MAGDLGTTSAAAASTLRRFNRTYTQRIGVLDESFLGTGRPLAVSRLLFETGPEGATVRELRDRLDLDSGYLSRLLARLTEDGLVEVRPDPADRRRRRVTLTAAGTAAWHELEQRSQLLAERLVAPLTDRQRDRLADALATADLLVRAATVHLHEAPPGDPRVRAATAQYFAELDRRFPHGFDVEAPDTEGIYVVAVSDGEPVACGGVLDLGDGTAEVKRMWVHDAWRGAGLGSRLLRHLEQLAARQGHHRVVLDTNATLTEAIAMYRRAGYTEVGRYNDNPYAELFFTKPLDA
ncbi:bifunctional helix-turn-helix transcriptional regulator/GNAT family N-acetyltransferase [Actinotalea sp. M2MS4P-6]|uniref:bifunctional helix-turn-helix transcriptional regulator/GNAT family N-acetyltransferase n=1 Tax=Actinotalea sp. M2MS4P-6 TaxID=2983762 RepID=UPI0021E45494|nr:bifunctional helix-turn-helix transcriptional regulator/GNAT family N-acetyltransferase [Actinotalea sp. M2MS4P-6]MCV2393934.1 bifunctional helix-turn-helix transcriptional regulator/GNAT family N-acetyltransferase [Actinotalea sp. M2MS4P-6]